MRRGIYPTILSAFVLGSAGLAAAEPGSGIRPNIIFILADDLGYGDLGCYGQKRIETPRLDRMASQGMRFTQFYAGSTVRAPSRCVLMTGLHTGHCFIRGNSKENLRPTDVTVAQVLGKAGYATGLFGKWGLGHEGSTGIPTRKGFDEFFGYLDQTHAHNYYPTFLLRNEERVRLRNVVPNEGNVGQGVATVRIDYSHDLIAEEALRFIERRKGAPFFLYLAVTLPHANNEAGKSGMEVPDLGSYARKDWPEAEKARAAMVSRLDRDVGRVLDALRDFGIDERTIVFFSSDNGPHAEGGSDPSFLDANGPLRGIKRDLYEGGIRVPLIVRWPGKVRAGALSDHVAWFADFMPTAADLAGAPCPAGLDGISLVPTLLGKPESQGRHAYLYWEFHERGPAQAVRMGRWKAVAKRWGGPVELYDMDVDPGESRDVAEDHPDLVAKVRAILAEAHVPSGIWKAPGEAR